MRLTARLVLVLGVGACAAPTPDDVLRSYAEAVARGDADEVRRLSAAKLRSEMSVSDVRAALDADPNLALQLSGPTVARRCELDLGDRTIRLVREAQAWRVSSGGAYVLRFDTPAASLAALFVAVEQGRMDVLRRVVPRRFQQYFGTEQALVAHLTEQMDRIHAAQAAIGADAQIRVDGDRAALVYGPGRSVRFEREDGEWKILDLE